MQFQHALILTSSSATYSTLYPHYSYTLINCLFSYFAISYLSLCGINKAGVGVWLQPAFLSLLLQRTKYFLTYCFHNSVTVRSGRTASHKHEAEGMEEVVTVGQDACQVGKHRWKWCFLTFVSVKPLDIFNETSGQFPASPFSLPACQIQQPGPRPPGYRIWWCRYLWSVTSWSAPRVK